MKQKRLSKLRLVRPADALLPLALLAAAVMGRSFPAFRVFACLMIVRLAALSSCTGLRAAFATQPSIRKVRGSVATALILQAAAGLAAMLVQTVALGRETRAFNLALGAATCLNLEACFYEYLYATGDGLSASMCRALTAILIFAGLMMGSASDYDPLWSLAASALAALVAAVIGLTIGGPLKERPNAQVVRCAPRAMLYTAAPLLLILNPERAGFGYLFAGWTLYELCHTPFRRSAMESRPMNRLLLIVFVACAALYGVMRIWRVQVFIQTLLPRRNLYYDIVGVPFALAMSALLSFVLFGSLRDKEA